MDISDLKEGSTWAGAMAAVAGLGLGLRKLMKIWAGDGRDLSRINAETDVLEMLRAELRHLAERNKAQAEQLVEMQELITKLKDQVSSLQNEISRLRTSR